MKILCPLMTLLTLTAASIAGADSGGYLFVTFQGEWSPMGEQVYFALSKDGKSWDALNQAKPVLISELGERGVRDPYVLRSHDQQSFYLIGTDLSIHHNGDWGRAVRNGSHHILVWESQDLVNWSEPRLVKVAPEDAGCTWAPEAVYDSETGDYLVFWASTTKRDNFAKHRIWAVRTKDFHTFGKPFIYIEKPTTVIDTTIVRQGDAYYRFTKDEKHKAITMETASSIGGEWTDMPEFSLAKMVGYEGPACYQLAPNPSGQSPGWCLILDHYARGRGYQPYTTGDLASGQFTAGEGFEFPFRFRHGSVLPISAEEYTRLENAYGIAKP